MHGKGGAGMRRLRVRVDAAVVRAVDARVRACADGSRSAWWRSRIRDAVERIERGARCPAQGEVALRCLDVMPAGGDRRGRGEVLEVRVEAGLVRRIEAVAVRSRVSRSAWLKWMVAELAEVGRRAGT